MVITIFSSAYTSSGIVAISVAAPILEGNEHGIPHIHSLQILVSSACNIYYSFD